jgi:hypothetical protein
LPAETNVRERHMKSSSAQGTAAAAMAGAGLGLALVSFAILAGWLFLRLY